MEVRIVILYNYLCILFIKKCLKQLHFISDKVATINKLSTLFIKKFKLVNRIFRKSVYKYLQENSNKQ